MAWRLGGSPTGSSGAGQGLQRKKKGKEDETLSQASTAAPAAPELALQVARAESKKKARKDKKDKDTESIMKLMAKMQLQQAQMLREHQGVLFDVVFMDTDSEVVLAMQEKGASYSEQTKGVKGHNMGPPHLHVFDAMIQALLKKKDSIGLANYSELKKFSDFCEGATQDDILRQVKQCRVAKCFENTKKKIYMAIEGTGVRTHVLDALRQLGGVQKHGRAPPGAMEIALQEFLDW
jgi:hypothetical protein